MKKTLARLAAAKLSKVAVSTIALLCLMTIGESAEAVENKRDLGIKQYNAKNFKNAIVLLDQHITVYPQDYYALYYDALACQALGDMGKAKIYYRQVASIAPTHQLGVYATTVLRQIDPTFASSQRGSSANSGGSSIGVRSTGGYAAATSSKLDTSIPMEWDVYCTPGEHGVWVDVDLDGRRVKMLFDTGAPAVTIGKNQLAEIGLQAPSGPANSFTGGSSTSGTIAAWVVPMKVKVGPVERTVPVQIIETNHADPLLGQTYFGAFEYTIDPSAKRIHFKQRGYNNSTNRNAYEVPFTFVKNGGRVVVNVEINGKTNPFIFDTGNTLAGIAFHSSAQASQYGVQIPDDAAVSMSSGVSGSGAIRTFTVRRARLGPIDRTDLSVAVSETAHNELPLLGQPFWQGFEYTINQQKKVIEFVRR
ncbi:hypothetical protein BH11CYA1_BH11CYA1_39790 [soil metagenome]